MEYRTELTPRGEETYFGCLEYLLYHVGRTGNPQAARHFITEYEQALDYLEQGAEGYALCEDEALRDLGYRKIHFRSMSYKILYRVEGETAFIEGIFHDSQVYETVLAP